MFFTLNLQFLFLLRVFFETATSIRIPEIEDDFKNYS